MLTTVVGLGDRAYPIHIGAGLLAKPELVLPHLPQKRVAVVTNDTIAPIYLEQFTGALQAAGVVVLPIVVKDGEAFKTWDTLNEIFNALLAARCERKTTLIALGGGVIGDLTGFAAATFLRGVPFLQVPTTLLSQVDSSVGGKTGINHPLGKNMIGAFYQPTAVLADIGTLDTLPDRELSAGLAEVIKYGVLGDAAFFAWLEANIDPLLRRDRAALAHAIERCCRNKADIVEEDERETGRRALLNLGHTFGHAIEAALGFGTWLHGEAVAAGMVLAARASRELGHLPEREVARIEAILERARLPVNAPGLPLAQWLDLMGHDKKVEGGKLRFVLLRALGDAYVDGSVPPDVLARVLSARAANG
ncbi:MAG: 3-dehydroquinate synthase [Betaproteobacteria bacterium]|nr:3-dehydroquinate synthase [Betaproteobacteria bacterium]